MGRGRRKAPAGWVRAPTTVELEIRAVWQEDEMPDELKNSPGYRPFTLGIEAQAWVDSMSDVMDGGDAVYGRPRPSTPAQHPSLASSPPPPQPSDRPSAPSLAPQPRWTVPRAAPPLAPINPPPAARVLMPDIEEKRASAAPPRTLPKRVMMPDIGGDDARLPQQPERAAMPDIGEAEAQPEKHPQSHMPDIGEDEERVEKQRPVMPDIG